MHPMLNIAVRAARAAGDIILRNVDRVDRLNVDSKRRNDFVSDVDRMAEREIIQVLHRSFPDHAILAEETGAHGDHECTWIIDPLDGTTNFLHGFPQFAVSIALRKGRHLDQAVVYDPLRQDLFTASRGAGAELNSRRLRVSRARNLDRALLGTGIPYREDQDPEFFLACLRAFMTRTAGVRRAGAASLDLAYVAAGRLDGFWEQGLQPWDMAAGTLLIREAGGLVGDFRGDDRHLESGDVLAANPKLFHQMLQKFRPLLQRRSVASG